MRSFGWLVLAMALVVSGCASRKLQRCEKLLVDPMKQHCPVAHDDAGKYRDCDETVDIYDGCVDPR